MEEALITESKMKTVETMSATWVLEDWNSCHTFLVAEASCLVKLRNAHLRFFLQPVVEKSNKYIFDRDVTNKWYSLCVQLISSHHRLSFSVTTEVEIIENGTHPFRKKSFVSPVCIRKSASNPKGIETVQKEFLLVESWRIDWTSGLRYENREYSYKVDISAHKLKLNMAVTVFAVDESQSQPSLPSQHNSHITEEQQWRGLPKEIYDLVKENNELFADVKLLMKDETVLHGHKIVLAGSSPVFKAMFSTDMKESNTDTVSIPDISSREMKMVLNYIYTGNAGFVSSINLTEVIYAAEKYQLGGLLEHCANLLIKMCDNENVMELLKVAKHYNLVNAVGELTEYCKMHATEILMSQLSAS